MDREWMAAEYDALYSDGPEQPRPPSLLVRQLVDALGAGEVVDFGAGMGSDSLYLAEQGFSVTALDLSRVAVDALNRQADRRGLRNLVAEIGDARTPLTREVDGVLSLFFAHYLSRDQAAEFFATTRRQTRPGGVHAHGVFAAGSGPLLAGPDPFIPTREELLAQFAGWEVLLIADWLVTPRATHVRADWPALSIIARRPHGPTR